MPAGQGGYLPNSGMRIGRSMRNLFGGHMGVDFVVHEKGDGVGVVVVEGLKKGQECTGWIMQ